MANSTGVIDGARLQSTSTHFFTNSLELQPFAQRLRAEYRQLLTSVTLQLYSFSFAALQVDPGTSAVCLRTLTTPPNLKGQPIL
ncbi:MAG: hypothetical protein SWY16_03745 [Cyanobacteriota bacterium]|nr:hypothetical protein [Cyanobacteriota bacterium]